MKRWMISILACLSLVLLAAGCGMPASQNAEKRIKVGIMLSDNGLGDQSFNDKAFMGLMKARDDLHILFDYRDLEHSGNYEKGLTELTQENCDLVIGMGFTMVEDFTKTAKKFPKQKFLFIDDKIDAPNVTSLTFKEEEGSFLVGVIAGLRSQTGVVGFIGGMDVPIIHKFKNGFTAGVRAVKPDASVLVRYANDFGKPEIGRSIARDMIEQGRADVIYPAAGFTGVGALEEAQRLHKYAIGVDSDQFYLAEKAVLTSMLKNIDTGIYSILKTFKETGNIPQGQIQMGIKENGVSAASMRISPLTAAENERLEALKQSMLNGSIAIPH